MISHNISGYKSQVVNLVAGLPQEITGPGRGFEIIQPGDAGNNPVILAVREARGQFSDDSPSQAFVASPGLQLVNFDKLVMSAPVDSKMKIKIYTSKTIATVDTGADLDSFKTLWSTGIQGHSLTAVTDDPFELSGPDQPTSGASWPTSRGDGLRELKYSDRSNITNDQELITPAVQFAEVQRGTASWWCGWLSMDSDFDMDVYAAPFNGPTTATPTEWRLVQKFGAVAVDSDGTVPSTDGSQTFTGGATNYVLTFDGQGTKRYRIPYGCLRVYLTRFSTNTLYGILGAKAKA